MEERNDFFKWYNKKVSENPEEPPAHVWDNIADELDTNEVWERVAADLDARPGWFSRNARYYGIAVALLLLLAGGSYYHDRANGTTQAVGTTAVERAEHTPLAQNDLQPGLHREDDREGGTRPDQTRADRIDHTAREISPNTSTEAHGTAATQSQNTAVADTRAEDVARTGDKTAVEYATKTEDRTGEAVNADVNGVDTGDRIMVNEKTNRTRNSGNRTIAHSHHVITPNTPDSKAAKTIETFTPREARTTFALSRICVADSMLRVRTGEPALQPAVQVLSTRTTGFRKSISIGVTASVKNTWLLNRNTFTGLEKQTLHTTQADFGKDVGVVVTYDFSPVFALQLEGLFLSEMGQRYREYLHGKYVKRDIDLSYYRGDVLLKYSPGKYFSGSPSNAHALIGGLFYGALKNKAEKINGNDAPPTNGYASNNYGAIVGYEHNRYLTDRLELTTGLRINLGLRDIGTNSWTKTTTGSFNLNIAVKYRFIVN